MQKWEKKLIIILFILGLIGGFLGFVMSKSGIGDIIIWANIDIFNILECILLIISTACTIFDIYETYESQKLLGNVEFKVILHTRNRLRNIILLLILINISELGIFLNSIDMHVLPLCLITLMFTLMLVLHNLSGDNLGENGILYCGIYHSWDDIKSYNITNENLLEMTVMNNFFGYNYDNKIRFNFDEKSKEGIANLLSEKICIINESNVI